MSNATKSEGTKIIKAITIGNSPVHMNCINWSYRNRGNVALNQTKRKQKTHVFSANTILCKLIKESLTKSSGIIYPPKNKMAVKVDISTILQYSARKKNTKIIPECSVKKPATSSDSASGKSKGVRFVSANADIKNIMNRGNNGTTNHTLCCISIIFIKLKVPVIKITANTAEL